MPTEIICVEDIYESYQKDLDKPAAINKCIKNEYTQNRNLKYVLLGGDDTVVPVRYCYGNTGVIDGRPVPTDSLATDLYYACLSGDLNWNANGNNKFGEVNDGVDLCINVNVSRLPVRTSEEVSAYFSKLFAYEKPIDRSNPVTSIQDDKFLSAGAKMFFNFSEDEQYFMAQKIRELADSLWGGDHYLFLDGKTSFDLKKDGDYELTTANLQEQLSSGYRFMDMFTHGEQDNWILEGQGKYNSTDAANLTSSGHTLITTISCYTNAFDSRPQAQESCRFDHDPCLSEAFIRNKNSGVIGYLGASHQGLRSTLSDMEDGNFGPSMNYEIQFYNRLFSNRNGFRSFAKVVSEAKREMSSLITDSTPALRWVHYCLNPVGDAEMPLYLHSPSILKMPEITSINNDLYVMSDNADCRITVSGIDECGKPFYGSAPNKGMQVHFTNVTAESIYLCLTRPDSYPLFFYGKRGDADQTKRNTKYTFTEIDNYPYTPITLGDARITGCVKDADNATVYIGMNSSAGTEGIQVMSYDSFGKLKDQTSVLIQINGEEAKGNVKITNGVNVIVLSVEGTPVESATVVF